MTAAPGNERGIALVTVLLLAAVLLALLVAYYTVTLTDLGATGSSMDNVRGFYAAEAGINLRARDIREIFIGYNRPAGTSPDEAPDVPCRGGNDGAGDFGCVAYALQQRSVDTYVVEDAGNPFMITVPRGEWFQNLSAQVYRYRISSTARNAADDVEAALDLVFQSRLIPLFQFAVFYNKDLEILPGPAMVLAGPVHTNGDLYLDAGTTFDIQGQVSTAGDLYRGRKEVDSCNGDPVRVDDPAAPRELPPCGGVRTQILEGALGPWNGMIETGVEAVTVPAPEELDATPGALYWDRADLRIMLDLSAVPPVIEIRNPDDSVDGARTAALGACGAASRSTSFYNFREATAIQMLDVNLRPLLDCAHTNLLLYDNRTLDDTTDGGLVFYLGVEGPAAAGINNYGVRVRDGGEIAATVGGAPAVAGLTIASNQAAYIQGDYNAVGKRPAAVLADSLNILSKAWNDDNSLEELGDRIAASTTINAALLAGTDTSGGVEGAAGHDLGGYNGGVENYPRFHERWTGRTLTYRGSFVSLNTPRHVDGAWEDQSYTPPNRDWNYDTDFNDAANLPPLCPRFVYQKQELFDRQFEM